MSSFQFPEQYDFPGTFQDTFSDPPPIDENLGAPLAIDTSMQAPPAKRARKAPTLNADAWIPHKDRVLELHDEGYTIREVARIMKDEKEFEATERQYRTRISQWKKDKNVKPIEMQAVVRKRQCRKLMEPEKLPQRFTVRDRIVTDGQIDRWMKRNDVSDAELYQPDTDMTTPSVIDCHTVSSTGNSGISPQPLLHNIPTPSESQYIHVLDDIAMHTPPSLRDLIGSPVSDFAGQTPAMMDVDCAGSNLYSETFSAPLMLSGARHAHLDESIWSLLLSQDDGPDKGRVACYENPIEYVTNTYCAQRYRAAEEKALLAKLQHHKTSDNCSCEAYLMIMVELGRVLYKQIRHKTAAAVLKYALVLSQSRTGPCLKVYKRGLAVLGMLFVGQERYKRAEVVLRRAVLVELPEDSESDQEWHLRAMATLGRVLTRLKADKEAEFLLLQALKYCAEFTDKYKIDWPECRILATESLFGLYTDLGRLTDAEAILGTLLTQFAESNKETLMLSVDLLENITLVYVSQNRDAELELLLRELVLRSTTYFGAMHHNTLVLKEQLAIQYQETGRSSGAESLLRSILIEFTSKQKHPDIECVSLSLALSLADQRKWEEANQLGDAAVRSLKRMFGLDHHFTMYAIADLGFIYQKQMRSDEAYQLLRNAFPELRDKQYSRGRRLHRAIKSLLEICTAQEKWDEVEELLKVEQELPTWQKMRAYST